MDAGKQVGSRCPRCGRAFPCQGEQQAADCWCMSMPVIDPALMAAYPSCLCRHCLQALSQQVAGNMPEC